MYNLSSWQRFVALINQLLLSVPGGNSGGGEGGGVTRGTGLSSRANENVHRRGKCRAKICRAHDREREVRLFFPPLCDKRRGARSFFRPLIIAQRIGAARRAARFSVLHGWDGMHASTSYIIQHPILFHYGVCITYMHVAATTSEAFTERRDCLHMMKTVYSGGRADTVESSDEN